jgi:hypothetical protein
MSRVRGYPPGTALFAAAIGAASLTLVHAPVIAHQTPPWGGDWCGIQVTAEKGGAEWVQDAFVPRWGYCFC